MSNSKIYPRKLSFLGKTPLGICCPIIAINVLSQNCQASSIFSSNKTASHSKSYSFFIQIHPHPHLCIPHPHKQQQVKMLLNHKIQVLHNIGIRHWPRTAHNHCSATHPLPCGHSSQDGPIVAILYISSQATYLHKPHLHIFTRRLFCKSLHKTALAAILLGTQCSCFTSGPVS